MLSSLLCGALVRRGGIALAAVMLLTAAVGNDPVEDLRQALPQDDVNNPTEAMLQFRRENLQRKIDALKEIGELRRALALDEWRDDPLTRPADKNIRFIDAEKRRQVAERLSERLKADADSPDPNTRLAVANVIAEIGPSIRAVGDERSGYARSLTPIVVKLAQDPDLGVRQEALRALGSINARPQEATKVFAQVLKQDKAVGPRRIAADGLGQLLRVVIHLNKRSKSSTGVEADRAETLTALHEVIQAVPAGAQDADPQVRYLSMEALHTAAQALSPELTPDAYPKKDFPPAGRPLTEAEAQTIAGRYEETKQKITELKPVLEAINAQSAILAQALGDPEPRVRQAATSALLHTAWARQRLRQYAFSLPALPGEGRDPQTLLAGADPLENFLKKGLAALAPLFSDPDARLRKTASYVLVFLEDRAAPLADILNAALTDSDRTVRWAAAKTLGHLPIAKAVPAVGNLAKLLSDEDVQTRVTAAQALQGLGPAARDALSALIQAVTQGDTESRIGALAALEALGLDEAKTALPQLTRVLGERDADPKILIEIAKTMGRMRAAASPAVPALRRLLGHEDAEVRLAASEAILAINSAERL